MAALEQALHGLAAGAGQVLLLIGEAGIGKSRLVTEVHGLCPQQLLWLEGRCLEMTTATSYWPFQDALRDYFGWHTHRLPGPARVLRWGHWGTPVLLFPTAGGDFEEMGLLQSLFVVQVSGDAEFFHGTYQKRKKRV